jgi:signal transduction histidine kinase
MRYFRWARRPSKRNLITLAAVAIVLPTGALALMQYRSLVDLESKTKIAIEENLRQTVESVARNAQGDMQTLAREILAPLGSISRSPEDLKQALGRASQLHPEVDQFFVFSTCSCKVENRFALLYSSSELRRVSGRQLGADVDVARILDAHRSSLALRPPAESTRELLFWQQTCSLPKEASHSFFYVFYPLKNTDVAGLILNPQYVRKEYLKRLIPELLNGSGTKGAGAGLAIGVFDEKQNQIYANASGVKNYQVKMAFAPVFPNWDLAAAYRGSSIESVAQASFEKSLLLTAFVLFLLLVGITLTLRAASREMSLAAAKSSFVSNVSHELKTPLALIRLYAETLELDRVKDDQQAKDFLRTINGETRRLTQLINNILDFSKIEAGRKEYRLVSSDVAEVVETVLRTYEFQLRDSGFEVSTRIDHGLPIVSIDPEAVSQAVVNLLNNATKYSEDTKRIEVAVAAKDSHIVIEVSDHGIGIPHSDQQKIFEKFYRVSTALVHNTKGSGLGLALVKHVVEAHGGKVLVNSEPGRGSRFTILIPIPKTESAPTKAAVEIREYPVEESSHH